MKKVLITGKNSYIGTSFVNYCQKNGIDLEFEAISVRDGNWKNKDFSQYDVLLNVAGIAHRTETKGNKELYFKVNRDLAIEIANKAKKDGIKQFVFLSTMSVYGLIEGIITNKTNPNPKSFYGKSKLEAENKILKLEDHNFNISIIRPPMIYGRDCKGNYQQLAKIAKTTPIFPNINNSRSMLHIDNLSEFLKLIILNKDSGFYFPQNSDYVNTSEMVYLIAKFNNHNVKFVNELNHILKRMPFKKTKKAFGNLFYELDISGYSEDYRVIDLKDSIKKTEACRE